MDVAGLSFMQVAASDLRFTALRFQPIEVGLLLRPSEQNGRMFNMGT